MIRINRYSLSAFGRYQAYPVVLTIAIDGFACKSLKKEFSAVSNKSFLAIMESKCWAKEFLLLPSKTIINYINETSRISWLPLVLLKNQAEPILKRIYNIAEQIMDKKKYLNSINPTQATVKRKLETVLEEINDESVWVLDRIIKTHKPNLEKIRFPNEIMCRQPQPKIRIVNCHACSTSRQRNENLALYI